MSQTTPGDHPEDGRDTIGSPNLIHIKSPEFKEAELEPDQPTGLPEMSITFEDILEKLGCFGPYQVLTMFSYLTLEIACAFVAFIPIFVGRSTSPANCTGEHETTTQDQGTTQTTTDYFNHSIDGGGDNDNDILISSTESIIASASAFKVSGKSLFDGFQEILDSPFKYESIVDEWDLTCDRAWVPDMFTSCLMAGMIAGNILSSQMGDWYGRRKTYFSFVMLMAIGTTLSGLSPSIYFYAVARFISGAAFVGLINIPSMAVMEFMTPKWRSIANCVGPMGEGIMLLSLLGYFIRPWRMLYLVTMAPYILIIPIYMFLPESPRWLLRNKKIAEAHEILDRMAKINKRPPIRMDVLEALRKQEELNSDSGSKKITYLDFIKNRSLLVTALYLCAIWFAWNVAYYGISFNIRNVPGDPYINLAIIGFANAVGKRASFIFCDWLGRRRAVLASMCFSAAFLVTLAICFLTLTEVSHYLILVGCFCGLLGMACCRASALLLSGESFPTAVRTMGLGIGSLGADVAGLLTPQLAFIGSKWPALPFFVFATVAVLGSLVVFMMKETSGNPLADEVEVREKKKKREV